MLNSVGCRNMSASHSNNYAVWNNSYCGGGGCSAAWSNSCGDGGDCVCFHRRREEGQWMMAAAGRTLRLPSESRCVGWSRTSWRCPAEELRTEDWQTRREDIDIHNTVKSGHLLAASVLQCAHLVRSALVLMLLERSSSLSYRRGLSKKYALELKLWLLIIPPGA